MTNTRIGPEGSGEPAEPSSGFRPAPPAPTPAQLAERLDGAPVILLVEDDEDIAAFLRAFFRASGFDLHHRNPSTAQEVVDAAGELQPAAVLLDYRLQGCSGREVYRRLRSDDRFLFTPIVLVTADQAARARTCEEASGIDAFVAKPFNVQHLAGLVEERIARAATLAGKGFDENLGVLTRSYLEARIDDELRAARASGDPVALALVQLRTPAALRDRLGETGVSMLARDLIDESRQLLPDVAVVGLSGREELAVLVPGSNVAALRPALEKVLLIANGAADLGDGTAIDVAVAAGLAGYPDHARTTRELLVAADAALSSAVDSGQLLRVAL